MLVGATVMLALIILGGMIIIFRELPAFVRPGYELRFTHWDTGPVREGSDVLLAGIRIGRVSEITFTEGNARKGVTIIATIDQDVSIPGNVNAYFRSGGFAGGGAIELSSDRKSPGSERTDPITKGLLAWLPKDNAFTMKVGWRPDGGIGPISGKLVKEIREAMCSFKNLADSLDTFLAPPPAPPTGAATSAPSATTTTTAPATPRPKAPPNLQTTIAKLDAALDAIAKNLGDKENQANFKAALANLNTAAAASVEAMKGLKTMVDDVKGTMGDVSGAAKAASKRFDDLMTHLINDADRLAKVLTSMHRITTKIDKGQGTAGRLINDPALYENLVNAAKQLQTTLDSLQLLLDKWKKEGVRLKVK